MNNIPRLRTGAATLGLAALLSVGALACTDDSTDSPVLGGDASTGTPSSAVEAPTDNRHHGDHGADVQTHAAAMELVEMANATPHRGDQRRLEFAADLEWRRARDGRLRPHPGGG